MGLCTGKVQRFLGFERDPCLISTKSPRESALSDRDRGGIESFDGKSERKRRRTFRPDRSMSGMENPLKHLPQYFIYFVMWVMFFQSIGSSIYLYKSRKI